ncbi:MAG TPA: MBL fold metallo-hydrolase [Hyphomicrobiaceae bacterium]|nr:MBL fold metallo-hydrolase [Hyphomicrobiaceae bacterium]
MAEISRRDVVIGASGAFALFGLAKPVAFIGTANAQLATTGHFKHKVGDIEVVQLHDGIWEKAHDAGFIKNASIDDTKAALKGGGLTDAHVPINFTVTAIKTSAGVVLIDSGTGGQTGGPKAGKLMANMAAAGIDPKSVKKIVVSHFHPDHIFGLMAKDTNAQIFPEAEIVVPAAEYKFWTDPALPAKLPEARRPLAERIQKTMPTWKNVKPAEGEAEVAPGIRMVATPGHTPGHTSYHVSSGGQQLIVLGDVSNLPALFVKNPGWHAVFDQDAATAEASRRKIFDRAIADKVTVAGYHFGMPNVGTLAKDGNGYAFTALKA